MFSTYKQDDVTILLKDISGMVKPIRTAERERYIQSGVHYSEMLPLEHLPSEPYLNMFYKALNLYSSITANAVATVAKKIYEEKRNEIVLVSLARAGTPIGILIKRYIEEIFCVPVFHYTISIIRDKGIDKNAMSFILSRHKPDSIQFVDGWTGKGAIQRELCLAMLDFPGVNSGLAVLSDPAGIADKSGTYDDFLIASSCLNSTVSGLLSRTFYRADIIKPTEFHGAAFYKNLIDEDLTYHFIDTITNSFPDKPEEAHYSKPLMRGMDEVINICRDYGIANINFVKPSIGEATRVLLRRVPWKVLVHSLDDYDHLGHLYLLADEKGVELEVYPLKNYRACGLIRSMADN